MERDKTTFNDVYNVLDFNSHAHVERDYLDNAYRLTLTISTHTLTWSVTVAVSISNNPSIFQLTRSRGA